uniref:choice-of-anchor U domain-containing protein n=1 Tax=Synechococcus sp. UW140 TaxID=368503 RepID=UPI003138052F
LDVANNALHALPDLGFGSWEGATAVDTGNTNQVALILGDDYASATLGAPIYMYVGTKSTAANASFLQRNGLTGGKLYAWVATSGAALNRPSEFKGFGTSADGNWVEIATKDATKAGTTGYDAQGYKSADLLRKDADSKNAFLAARIEDLDYNPNNFKQVAFVATGNETFDGGVDLLGTVYTLDVTFNGAVPAASKLKIVYDGDDAGNGSAGLRSPDNIAFSKDGFIYAQEDKAVYSTASDSKYGTEKGSIWKLDPTTGKAIRWAQIDDSIDPDGAGGQALDTKDSGYLAYGWESSGIIDVSALYNHAPGTDFFANVQTHGVKGGAITDQNLVAGGQILKLESAIAKTNLSYTPSTGGNAITAKFTPKSGSLEGDASFNRLAASPSFTNKNPKLDIGKTGLNFSLRIDQSSTDKTADVSVDLTPMLDGLSTTGKRLAYFVYDTPTDGSAPLATAFTYDPIKKAGARFYDLDGNGTAETANLEFVDGGYGDKDGVKNGVIVDPSTPGVVSIAAIFTATTNSLSVGDPTDSTSPAAIIVKASISSRANSVNQVGYVALNSSEANTLTYDLIRDRGTILMANLESSNAPNVSAMKLENNITLINGQKLVFFEIVDTTLEALMAKGSTIDSFGSNFQILDVTKQTDTTATASKGGNTLALSLQPDSVVASLGDLISTEMGENPILDFSALTGSIITGSVSLAREASYDSSIGFYRIQRNDGAVLDPITNTLITPGSAGYKAAALSASNLFTGFGNLSISNGATRTDTLAEFSDAGMLAPYATVAQTGETFFSFKGANSDGMNHFRMLGSGVIGLEDVAGGFDQDFDDNVLSFNFKLK